MRQYKIVARVLLILSVFSFVLAAPIAVREVREVYKDVVARGNNVIIGLGKRVKDLDGDTEPLLPQEHGPSSSTDWLTPSQFQESSSVPTSGADPKPSFSSSGGSGKPIPPATSIEMQPLFSTKIQPAGTSTNIQPWTSSEIQSAGTSEIQSGPPKLTKSVSFSPIRGVSQATGEMHREFAPSDAELVGRPPLPPSPGPEREKNLLQLQIAKLKTPPKPQSQAKKLWKMVFSKLRKAKLWRRISRTADSIFD